MSGNGDREQNTERALTRLDFEQLMGPDSDAEKKFEHLIAQVASALLDPEIKTIRIRKNKIGRFSSLKTSKK